MCQKMRQIYRLCQKMTQIKYSLFALVRPASTQDNIYDG